MRPLSLLHLQQHLSIVTSLVWGGGGRSHLLYTKSKAAAATVTAGRQAGARALSSATPNSHAQKRIHHTSLVLALCGPTLPIHSFLPSCLPQTHQRRRSSSPSPTAHSTTLSSQHRAQPPPSTSIFVGCNFSSGRPRSPWAGPSLRWRHRERAGTRRDGRERTVSSVPRRYLGGLDAARESERERERGEE